MIGDAVETGRIFIHPYLPVEYITFNGLDYLLE
jgi:hypothetical protein